MSEDMLNDDQLDAVAGGTVVFTAKVANTAYAATVLKEKAHTPTPPTPPTFTIDRTVGTAGLGALRSRGTP